MAMGRSVVSCLSFHNLLFCWSKSRLEFKVCLDLLLMMALRTIVGGREREKRIQSCMFEIFFRDCTSEMRNH